MKYAFHGIVIVIIVVVIIIYVMLLSLILYFVVQFTEAMTVLRSLGCHTLTRKIHFKHSAMKYPTECTN
jgi:uncharacterized membrane protein